MDSNLPKIDYFYIKKPDFSTTYANGVVGGINARGQISINFFVERTPIPQHVSHEVEFLPDGSAMLGKEVSRDVKDGIIREVQAGVLLDIDIAISVRNWLTSQINAAESIKNG